MSASLVAEGRARAPATVQERMVNGWDLAGESDAREVRGLDLRSGDPAAPGRGRPRARLAEGLRPPGGAAPRAPPRALEGRDPRPSVARHGGRRHQPPGP